MMTILALVAVYLTWSVALLRRWRPRGTAVFWLFLFGPLVWLYLQSQGVRI